MIEEPEESKYTANLLIFNKNNELQQDSYFLSWHCAARCAFR
jgi:hypothetical protein